MQENTTWDLIKDIEKIRKELDISNWSVFGGSWGSTLALSYAIKNSEYCNNLILRGIFMLRKKNLNGSIKMDVALFIPMLGKSIWNQFLKVNSLI